jgi:hypothetical protein
MGAAEGSPSHVLAVVWIGFFIWVVLQLLLGWGV